MVKVKQFSPPHPNSPPPSRVLTFLQVYLHATPHPTPHQHTFTPPPVPPPPPRPLPPVPPPSQALTFIQVCLSAVLNLRLPEQSHLTPAAPTDPTQQQQQHQQQHGTPLEQLATVLLEGGHPPMIRPVASRVELGTKTKTQLVAEKAVLTSLLTAVISAAGDDLLADQAMPFCRSICRCVCVGGGGAAALFECR
jgi:hypothetical protein